MVTYRGLRSNLWGCWDNRADNLCRTLASRHWDVQFLGVAAIFDGAITILIPVLQSLSRVAVAADSDGMSGPDSISLEGCPHMLVLSRKRQEKIVFPGLKITVQVLDIQSGRVGLGIEAPPEVEIMRKELLARPLEHRADRPEMVVLSTS
jgi:carbon storage regulator CsrA